MMVSRLETANHPTLYYRSILNAHEVFVGVPLHSYNCACWGQIPKFGLLGLQVSPNNMMASCLETANNHNLYYRSILYAFDLFEPLHMLWMGIWVHPYTVGIRYVHTYKISN